MHANIIVEDENNRHLISEIDRPPKKSNRANSKTVASGAWANNESDPREGPAARSLPSASSSFFCRKKSLPTPAVRQIFRTFCVRRHRLLLWSLLCLVSRRGQSHITLKEKREKKKACRFAPPRERAAWQLLYHAYY